MNNKQNNFEFDSVEPFPDRKNAQIVAFKERYQAENFLANTPSINGIGKVDLAWVPNTVTTPSSNNVAVSSSAPPSSSPRITAKDADTVMHDSKEGRGKKDDANDDVAEEDYRWMDVA